MVDVSEILKKPVETVKRNKDLYKPVRARVTDRLRELKKTGRWTHSSVMIGNRREWDSIPPTGEHIFNLVGDLKGNNEGVVSYSVYAKVTPAVAEKVKTLIEAMTEDEYKEKNWLKRNLVVGNKYINNRYEPVVIKHVSEHFLTGKMVDVEERVLVKFDDKFIEEDVQYEEEH